MRAVLLVGVALAAGLDGFFDVLLDVGLDLPAEDPERPAPHLSLPELDSNQ